MRKRVILVAMAALLAIGALTALTGCGQSDEDVIKESLSNELSQLKDPSSEYRTQLDPSLSSNLQSIGFSSEESQAFLDSLFDSLEYNVGEVLIEGDVATVSADITIKQYNPIFNNALTVFQSEAATAQYATQDEAYNRLKEPIQDELANITPATTPIQIHCSKVDNTWTATDADTTLAPALMGQEQIGE